MRTGLTIGILALTALVFFTAIQTLPVEASRTAAAETGSATGVDENVHAQIVEENSGLRAELAQLEEQNSTLLASLDDDTLAQTAEETAGLRAELAKLEEKNSTLLASLDEETRAQNEEAAGLRAKLAKLEEQNSTLLASLDGEARAQSEENSGLRAELAKLEEQNSALLASLDDAQAGQSELATNLAALKAMQPKVSDAEHNALLENLAALKGELSEARQLSENSQLEVQNKIAEITQAQDKIAALEASKGELERRGRSAAAKVAELEIELRATGSQGLEQQSQMIAERDAALENLANLRKEIEDQSRISAELTDLVGVMKTRIKALQSDVVEKENKIAELSASTQVATISPATICRARSNALTAAITFKTGSTSITDGSMGFLSELADIANECIKENVVLEIEGHTDSSGRITSNLLLSNGRANAVRAFLAENGVPTDAMRAVGFGASDPIADNATAQGRLLNQRIVFDWEMK